jgi:hypothetical protein
MIGRITAGDLVGAARYFSSLSATNYMQAFVSMGSANVQAALNQVGTLNPSAVINGSAEYFFSIPIAGQTITFPVQFVKENGVWKISEF